MNPAQIVKEEKLTNRCTICKVRTYSFCRCLDDEKLNYFSKVSFEKNFSNKENIFLQNDSSTYLYNITEGNVKIYQLLDDGRIQITGFLYPGDFFGSYKNNKYNYFIYLFLPQAYTMAAHNIIFRIKNTRQIFG